MTPSLKERLSGATGVDMSSNARAFIEANQRSPVADGQVAASTSSSPVQEELG